jgi:Flavin containing amine oxidoreductase
MKFLKVRRCVCHSPNAFSSRSLPVCTLPLAILQSDMVTFDPPLPPPKQQAIQRLGAGLLNKCVLSFSHVFWQESDFMGLAGLDDEETPYLILNGHAYLGKPILAFLYGGSHAEQVEEWTDAEVVADCVRVLKKICGRQIPPPVDYRVTRWGHEQYSRMAFTYIPPGVNGIQELKAMSDPVHDHTGTKPSLMFAGEHTSVFHPSTIHGAFLSGIREAYRLDLALFPQANDGMEFSDSELYERTFDVSRRYFESNSKLDKHESKVNDIKSQATSIPKDRKQRRRRGAAGVMTLRKRPNPSNTAGAINGTAPTPPSIDPVRKSPRAASASQNVFGVEGQHDRKSSEPVFLPPDSRQRPNMTTLEDEALLRGLESYGNDYEYLHAIVRPAHFDEANRAKKHPTSLPQLRKRCQMLFPTLRSLRAGSTTSWKRWVAKTVYPPTTCSGERNSIPVSEHKKVIRSATPKQQTPKSTTSQKSGATRAIDNRPQSDEVRTRLGRLVRGPSIALGTSCGDSSSRTKEATRATPTPLALSSTRTRFGRLVKRPEG